MPNENKGIHRNEWGYLPGNRYKEFDKSTLTTKLYGEDITVPNAQCQFLEFYFADGSDLKVGKNKDRRIVYDKQHKNIYLTMVHYDRWVDGTRNDDGSPKGNFQTYNPFVKIIDIA